MNRLFVLTCILFLASCKDPICDEIVTPNGQKYCAAPPTQSWDPGTVVLASPGKAGHHNVRRLCDGKKLGVPSYACSSTASLTADILEKVSGKVSAQAFKAVEASAQFKSIRTLKVTLDHPQICQIDWSELRNACFKHACGEAASSADQEDGDIVWISQALKADVVLDLTTEEAVGVVATADVVKVVSLLGGTAQPDAGVESLIKVQVEQEDSRHIKIRGTDLFWGFSGKTMSKELRAGLADKDCACGGEGRVCCDQAGCVAGLQCSGGLCARPPALAPAPAAQPPPCRFNTPGSLVDNAAGKVVYRVEPAADPAQVVFVLEQAPPNTWWKAIALREGQNERRIEVKDDVRSAELPHSPHEAYELRFGKAGALNFWAGVIEVPMNSNECLGKRVFFRWERQ